MAANCPEQFGLLRGSPLCTIRKRADCDKTVTASGY
jgi:hypothetical protein